MKRAILIHPDPRLKKVSAPVPDLSDALRSLGDDMLETMYDAPGIGLAAPQIGVLERVIVLDCAKSDQGDTPRPLVMYNPRVVASSEERNVYEEGCLSIPDQYADVERPTEVDVEWLDRDGNLQREGFDGLWATCVQHEIDHLEGKLFIDYLKPLKRQMITRKMVKLKKERAREKGVSIRPVVMAPDPVLGMVCARAAAFDGALGQLAIDLLQTMYHAQGRGLAAPQIGVTQRIFVMDAGWKTGAPAPKVFVNPDIVTASDAMATYEEGCLSIPNHPVRVARPAWVELHWQDLTGAPHKARFDGFEAVCVQHERDHLDGILITEKSA